MEKNKYQKFIENNFRNSNSYQEIHLASIKLDHKSQESKVVLNNYSSKEINSNNLIYGIDSKELEKHLKLISNKIEIVESYSKKLGLVEKYEETERELLNYINNKENSFNINQKKFFKLYIRQNLYEKFLSKDSIKRKQLEQKINEAFQKFVDNLDDKIDLKTIFGNQFSISNLNVELNDIEHLTYLLEAMENSHISECKSYLCSEINIDSIPQFLIHSNKKLLKQKVRKIWKINYEIPVNNMKLQTKFGYKFLNEKFLDLINERFNIFDNRFFSVEERVILLKILFLTNIKYLKRNPFNLQAFLDNYRKYIYLMDIGKFYKDIINYITNYLDCMKEDQFYLDDLTSHFEKLKEFLTNSNHFSILKQEMNKEKILLIVFSFSIMLNNLMTVVYDSVPGCEESFKVVFCSELKISSRERQFMINFFKSIDYYLINFENNPERDQFSCLDINFMLENSIFSSLIKSYTKVLFDEFNRTKLILNNSEILENFQKHCENSGNSDLMIIYENFNRFLSEDVILEGKQSGLKKIGNEVKSKLKFLFSNIKKKLSKENTENRSSIKSRNKKKIKIDLNNLKFVPFDPINISTHICISINGHILEGEIEKLWSNFTINEKSVDHYFFHWIESISDNKGFISDWLIYFKKLQNGITDEEVKENNNRQIFNKNKEISKVYGKILAFILASRSIFKFHTISLIGYSLGCNVIKHCILELNKMYDYFIEVNEIIQNVVFIAGAARISNKKYKFKEMFKIISGRIVNCYSSYDTILADFYSNDVIGLKALPNEDNELVIENYEFSHMKLNHDDYKRELANILNQINIL